jgi:hypothetical protein
VSLKRSLQQKMVAIQSLQLNDDQKMTATQYTEYKQKQKRGFILGVAEIKTYRDIEL